MSSQYPSFDPTAPYPSYSQPAAPVIDPFLASDFSFHPLASPTTEHPYTLEQQHGHAELQAAWTAHAQAHPHPSAITPPNGLVGRPVIGTTQSHHSVYHDFHLPNTPILEEPPTALEASVAGLPNNDPTQPLAVIEEDKRRRNTEASARFRVKKKEREEALSRNAAELTAKVTRLEARVTELERENGWLRSLIVGKGKAAETAEKGKGNVKRADVLRTDGVGTGDGRGSE